MVKDEIIEFVNKVIREEHGMPIQNGSDKLIDTGCDSFGIVMVLLAIEDKYKVYTKEELKDINIDELTLDTIVDRILNESNR